MFQFLGPTSKEQYSQHMDNNVAIYYLYHVGLWNNLQITMAAILEMSYQWFDFTNQAML